MKYGLCFVFVLLFTINGSAQNEWKRQISNRDYVFFDIHFIDTSNAISVGGVTQGTSTNGLIARTTNRGNNWILDSTTSKNVLLSVWYLTESIVFAVGDSGSILHSTDKGNTWVVSTSPTKLRLRSITLSQAGDGVIVGDSGVILTSHDSGNTWQVAAKLTKHRLNNATFIFPSTFIVVGDSGTLLKTPDNGLSWTKLPTSTFSRLNGTSFFDNMNGMIATDSGLILQTSDGGDTWIHGVTAKGYYSSTLFYHDISTITFGGSYGTIYHSNNNGSYWSRYVNSWESPLRKILFLDSLYGFAVGAGQILHMTNIPLHTQRSDIPPDLSIIASFSPLSNLLQCSVTPKGIAEYTIMLFDINGNSVKDMYRGSLSSKQTFSINVADLPSGTYFIKATSRDGAAIHQINFVR